METYQATLRAVVFFFVAHETSIMESGTMSLIKTARVAFKATDFAPAHYAAAPDGW